MKELVQKLGLYSAFLPLLLICSAKCLGGPAEQRRAQEALSELTSQNLFPASSSERATTIALYLRNTDPIIQGYALETFQSLYSTQVILGETVRSQLEPMRLALIPLLNPNNPNQQTALQALRVFHETPDNLITSSPHHLPALVFNEFSPNQLVRVRQLNLLRSFLSNASTLEQDIGNALRSSHSDLRYYASALFFTLYTWDRQINNRRLLFHSLSRAIRRESSGPRRRAMLLLFRRIINPNMGELRPGRRAILVQTRQSSEKQKWRALRNDAAGAILALIPSIGGENHEGALAATLALCAETHAAAHLLHRQIHRRLKLVDGQLKEVLEAAIPWLVGANELFPSHRHDLSTTSAVLRLVNDVERNPTQLLDKLATITLLVTRHLSHLIAQKSLIRTLQSSQTTKEAETLRYHTFQQLIRMAELMGAPLPKDILEALRQTANVNPCLAYLYLPQVERPAMQISL